METNVNNKCGAFTSLEQSKKLAEILLLESADMFYCYGMDIHTKGWSFDDTPTIIDNSNRIDVHADIPCWSLAALLGVLPKTINHKTLFIETSPALWHIGYRDVYIARNENPIDACVEMVLKLYELKYL